MAEKEVGTGTSFQFRNEQFFASPRKSRVCAEIRRGGSHKRFLRLTPRLPKRAIYGWKPANYHDEREDTVAAHHLLLGKTIDYITGEEVVDTDDERARQKTARFLVDKKGYSKQDVEVRKEIQLNVDGNRATSKVDFVVKVDGKAFAIIIFGPGSLVSRERSTLAAARLVENYAVPFAVVTNGKDAEVLDTKSGTVIGEGLEAIPSKEEAQQQIQTFVLEKVSDERLEKEQRILYAFDVLAERECNEFTCTVY